MSSAPVGPSPSGSRRARILVVDDEPLMGSAIARVLFQHDVVALTSGRSALARIAAGERFDVIICDLMMPDFNGIDFHAGIARDAPDLLDRLVFLTGGAYTTGAVDFLKRVPNARLEKPVMAQDLHDAVALALPALW